jgi:hypothetical protein
MDETQEAINFDALMENIYPDSNNRPKSFDAVFVYEKNIYLIEFKNQKPAQIDNQEIQQKLKEGKRELDKLLEDKNIQKRAYGFFYCVVYKNCKEPKERYKCGIGKNTILFGLEKYKSNLIKDVFTNQVGFFTSQFKKQFDKELKC